MSRITDEELDAATKANAAAGTQHYSGTVIALAAIAAFTLFLLALVI
jgi:hypothetical protein